MNANRAFGIRLALVLVGVSVAGTLLTLLYHHNPEQADSPWPACFTKKLTNLDCPGCGSTRCLYSLLHGDFLQALAYNVLFVFLLPYLVWSIGRQGYYYVRGEKVPRGKPWPKWTSFVMIGLIYSYGVVRNLPYEPFKYLAPHKLESRVEAPQPPDEDSKEGSNGEATNQ